MNDSVRQYEREVKKKLVCRYSTKKKLVFQFRSLISSFLDDNQSPSTNDLYLAFGPPDDVSKMLMEEVSEGEQNAYRKMMRIKRFTMTILIASVLFLMIYVFFEKENPVFYSEEIEIINPTVTSIVDK